MEDLKMASYRTITEEIIVGLSSRFCNTEPIKPEETKNYKGFTIGERVIALKHCHMASELVGLGGEVFRFNKGGGLEIYVRFDNGMMWYCHVDSLKPEKDLREKVL
jgi:hypothetical protein